MSQHVNRLTYSDEVASFLVNIAGTQKPRVIKRVSMLRRQLLLFGRRDDPAALTDLSSKKPDLLIRMPRPIAYSYPTEQPCQIVIVVGPADVLVNQDIAGQYAVEPQNTIPVNSPRFLLELETMNELHVVSGMPGSGRRNMVNKTLRRLESMVGPGQMSIIRTTTTRRPRCLTDSLYYEFLSREKFSAKRVRGDLIQVITYGSVSYGIDRLQATQTLKKADGICMLIETKTDELAKLGYPIFLTEVGVPPNLELLSYGPNDNLPN